MNIVLLHFHLKPGGVTRVIEEQAAACRLLGFHYLILAGDNQAQLENVRILSQLDYDIHRDSFPAGGDSPRPAEESLALADAIQAESHKFFGREPDIYHVHNPLLGKNDILLPALEILRDRAQSLILQIHDLAEDRRPQVYLAQGYPDRVHYAFLNSRDHARFLRAGLPEDLAHILPNQVSNLAQGREREKARQRNGDHASQSEAAYLLYPVRAIPRKNIGEVLALSILFEELEVWITLPPNNPAHIPVYEGWKSLARETGAPIRFEAGLGRNFAEILTGSRAVLSTSVQEGFGFAFLEAWTLGIPVFGRDIPAVTRDFRAQGLDLSTLYPSLLVPASSLDPGFRERWILGAREQLAWFSRNSNSNGETARVLKVLEDDLDAAYERIFSEPSLDFGRLDRRAQEGIIRELARPGSGLRQEIRDLNPKIRDMEEQLGERAKSGARWQELEKMIEANRIRVLEVWGIQERSKDLARLYRRVLEGKAGPFRLDKASLLEDYLGPAQYYPAVEFAEPETRTESLHHVR